ncbi:Hypothetical protein GSB_152877, partial [Giardia duodenalis]
VRPSGPVRGGAGPAGERRTSTASSCTHQLPDRAATYCLQMCGLLTDEERAVKERHGPGPGPRLNCPKTAQTRTTRHGTIVCTPACQGVQRGAGDQTHSHLRPEPEAGHLAIDKCKTIDVGVTLPRQTDHYCNEKLKKYRDGTPDHLRDGSPLSLAAPRRAPRGC